MRLKLNFNILSMFIGAGITGAGIKLYSIYPINETLMISVMGIGIWIMSFIMYKDKKQKITMKKESKEIG